MDTEKILNGVVFEYGWRTTSEYVFLNKKFEVTYIFDAYERSEEINEIQKQSLKRVCENENKYSNKEKEILFKYIYENNIIVELENVCNEIKLTSIFFTQEGEVLLLCEVPWDIENGLAIKIFPNYDIGPQDVFL